MDSAAPVDLKDLLPCGTDQGSLCNSPTKKSANDYSAKEEPNQVNIPIRSVRFMSQLAMGCRNRLTGGTA